MKRILFIFAIIFITFAGAAHGQETLRHESQDIIDQATAAAEARAFNGLSHDFRKASLARFFQIKDNIEDWEDVVTNKALLAGRLQTLAAKDPGTWTENNLLDMALICTILWNVKAAP